MAKFVSRRLSKSLSSEDSSTGRFFCCAVGTGGFELDADVSTLLDCCCCGGPTRAASSSILPIQSARELSSLMAQWQPTVLNPNRLIDKALVGQLRHQRRDEVHISIDNNQFPEDTTRCKRKRAAAVGHILLGPHPDQLICQPSGTIPFPNDTWKQPVPSLDAHERPSRVEYGGVIFSLRSRIY